MIENPTPCHPLTTSPLSSLQEAEEQAKKELEEARSVYKRRKMEHDCMHPLLCPALTLSALLHSVPLIVWDCVVAAPAVVVGLQILFGDLMYSQRQYVDPSAVSCSFDYYYFFLVHPLWSALPSRHCDPHGILQVLNNLTDEAGVPIPVGDQEDAGGGCWLSLLFEGAVTAS